MSAINRRDHSGREAARTGIKLAGTFPVCSVAIEDAVGALGRSAIRQPSARGHRKLRELVHWDAEGRTGEELRDQSGDRISVTAGCHRSLHV